MAELEFWQPRGQKPGIRYGKMHLLENGNEKLESQTSILSNKEENRKIWEIKVRINILE